MQGFFIEVINIAQFLITLITCNINGCEICVMQHYSSINRGSKLFQAVLFDEADVLNLPQKSDSKGRDADLIEARNNLLLHRFYFKGKIERKLYPDVLMELKKELFLSVRTIQDILQDKSEQVLEIKKLKPTAKELQKMFPFMVW
jgi:hypothetical protein